MFLFLFFFTISSLSPLWKMACFPDELCYWDTPILMQDELPACFVILVRQHVIRFYFFQFHSNFYFFFECMHTYTHFHHSLGFWWVWKVFSGALSETGQLSFILKWSVVVSTALGLGAFEWACISELSPLPADSCLGTDFSWTSHKVCFCLDWICPTFLLDVDLSLRVPHGMVLVFQMLDI